jgi:hypothetical protein
LIDTPLIKPNSDYIKFGGDYMTRKKISLVCHRGDLHLEKAQADKAVKDLANALEVVQARIKTKKDKRLFLELMVKAAMYEGLIKGSVRKGDQGGRLVRVKA